MSRQFGRDKMRCSRPGRQIAQNRRSLLITRVGITFAQHDLGTRLAARESPRLTADGPTGNDLREGSHISLRVSTAYTERMQLEYFARKVLIDPRAPITLAPLDDTSRPGMRPNRHMVVEI